MPQRAATCNYAIRKRVFDIVVSALGLMLMLPKLCLSLVKCPHTPPGIVRSLWKVLVGEWSIVGPSATSAEAFSPAEQAERATAKPGLICIFWLRRQTNIAFEPEMTYDREYLAKRCFRLDLKLGIKALIALAYGMGPRVPFQDRISMLGTPIDNLTMRAALDRMEETIAAPEAAAFQVSFVNPDCLNKAYSDSYYRRVLHLSQLVLADGIGLRIAGSLLRRPVRENVNGTDMFPLLCARLNARAGRLFLLGARNRLGVDVPPVPGAGPHVAPLPDRQHYFHCARAAGTLRLLALAPQQNSSKQGEVT